MGKSPDSTTGWRKLAIALLALLWLPFGFAQDPTPTSGVGPSSDPLPTDEAIEGFIGTEVTVPVTFENPGNATGYGPYLDVMLPTGDGIELRSAGYGDQGLAITAIEGETTVGHPLRTNNGGNPAEVMVPAGKTLYIVELPYGSVSGNTTPHDIDLNIGIAEEAPLNEKLDVDVHAGFHSNDSEFNGDGQYEENGTTVQVMPILARLDKDVDTAETETAVGKNFPVEYTITVEIAPGQQLDNLKIVDTLPDNIVITDIAEQAPWSFEVAGQHDTNVCNHSGIGNGLELGPCTNWELVATYTETTETTSGETGPVPTELDFKFTFYVPLEDAHGKPVALSDEWPDKVHNVISGEANWTEPKDTNDSEVQFNEKSHLLDISRNKNGGSEGDGNSNEHSGIMMIQKRARIDGREHHGRDTEGQPLDTVDFTLDFQISDHSAYDQVTITDELGNGLEYVDGTAELTIDQHGESKSYGVVLAEATDASTGIQTLTFTITSADDEVDLPDNLLGACVEGDCSSGTRGKLTYKAEVLDEYREATNPNALRTEGDYVVQGDRLRNEVEIHGRVLSTAENDFLEPIEGLFDSDDSRARVLVPRTTIEKNIVAINNTGLGEEEPPRISAGDEVTFSLRAELPTSDFRDFYITDEFPWPVFDVTDFSNLGQNLSWTPSSGNPDAGKAHFSDETNFPNEDEIHCDDPNAPTVLINGNSNSVTFDFGDYNCEGARKSVIEILVTATVQDVKLADGFIINNRMVNGENDESVTTSNRLIEFTRPNLNITKGVVKVAGNSSVDHDLRLEPPTDTKDGTVVKTDDNRSTYANDGIDGVDAGDIITYAIIIENTSKSTNKAHGITLTDDLLSPEAGLGYVDGSLKAWLGSGAGLGTVGDLFNGGITFTVGEDADPLALNGFNENGENADGDNIIVVTYEAQLGLDDDNDEIAPSLVPYGYEHTNTATVTEYYATDKKDEDGGENLGPVEDDATIRVTADKPVKSVVDTSEADTEDNDVAIGEIVRYRLQAHIPEGVAQDFTLEDVLPGGMLFIDGSARVAFVSDRGLQNGWDASDGDLNFEETPDSSAIVYEFPDNDIEFEDNNILFNFGTLINNDDDDDNEYVIVEFNALVLNKEEAGGDDVNSAGESLSNKVLAYTADTEDNPDESEAEDVKVVEPKVVVTKTVDPEEGLEAGDTLTYTVNVRNAGNATAYLIEVTDELDEWFENVSASGGSVSGNAVTFDLEDLNPGEDQSFEITARLKSGTPTGLEINNTATATYSSLPDGEGTEEGDDNTTGNKTPGDNDDWNGARKYETDGQVDFTTVAVGPEKRIVATSEKHTPESDDEGRSADVAIGEIVRYALTVNIPAGETKGLTLTDELPAGLQLINLDEATVSASGSEDLEFHETELAGVKNGPITLPEALWDADSASEETIHVELGDISNPPPGEDEEPVEASITIEFNALVLNVDDNTDGKELDNQFEVAYTLDEDGDQEEHKRFSENATVRITEPNLRVDKRVTAVSEGIVDPDTGNASGVDIGTTVTFEVTITNDGGASAFETMLVDELPGWLELLGADVTAPDMGYQVTTDANTLVLAGEPGTEHATGEDNAVTVTYTARVLAEFEGDSLQNGQEIDNTAIAYSTSLPENGTPDNETGSETPEDGGAEEGERLYSGTADESGLFTVVPEMTDTARTIVATPKLEVEKTLITEPKQPVNNADGTYTITYAITVSNNEGDIDLVNVQLTDNLADAFAGLTIGEISLTGVGTNGDYDGVGDTNIFADPGIALDQKEEATVTLAVTVAVSDSEDLGTYTNTVTANGRTVGGLEADETEDTQDVELTEDPGISIEKKAGEISDDGDGTYTFTYELTVKNDGDVNLDDVQVTDNLEENYGTDVTPTVVSVTLEPADGNLVLVDEGTYTGLDGGDSLLADGSWLEVGEDATITIRITVEPENPQGGYENLAKAEGTSPAGGEVHDESKESHTFEENPLLGLSTSLVAQEEGSFAGEYCLEFEVFLKNYGNVQLNDIQATLDLEEVFGEAVAYGNVNISSDDITVNPGFDGVDDQNLLAGNSTLYAENQREPHEVTITVNVCVTPGETLYYEFQAKGTGKSPFGKKVSDLSHHSKGEHDPSPGTEEPDPGEFDDPTPVVFPIDPELALAKRVSETALPVEGEDGWFEMEFTFEVQNTGNVPLSGVTLKDGFADAFADGSDYEITYITATPTLVATSDYGQAAADGQLLVPESELATAAMAALEDKTYTDRGTVTVGLKVRPAELSKDYENSAEANGTPPGEDEPTTDPEPSNDGDTPVPGEDVPTPFTFENPIIAIAKQLDSVEGSPDGVYTVTFTLQVENQGDVDLSNVQVTDNLDDTFRGAPVTITGLTAESPLTAASVSTAGSTWQLLDASQSTLPVGGSASITLTADVVPGDAIYDREAFLNSALAEGESPGGQKVDDRSNDGIDPDPDDDTPTPVAFEEYPLIGVAKDATEVTPAGDGRYDVGFLFTITNYGNVNVGNIRLTENLDDAFGAGTHEVLSLYSPTLSVNTVAPDSGNSEAFDGSTHEELLTGTDTLAVNTSAEVRLVVRVQPEELGTHWNQVTVSGDSPGGKTVEDDSQDGKDPDPDGDGDPTNNDDPTPVTFTEDPLIGLAKHAAVSKATDGTFDVTLTFTVRNMGDVPLHDVQVTDSLENIYGITDLAPEKISVVSSELSMNPGFDGRTDTNLLTGSDTLAVGAEKQFAILLAGLTPAGETSTTNTAFAEGTSPHDEKTRDQSTDGFDPDPNGDGNPDEDDPTPIEFTEKPQIALAKSAAVTKTDTDLYTVEFTFVIENTGNTLLLGVQLQDDLADYWANTNLTAGRISVSSADFTVNSGYDASSDIDMLEGTDSLRTGERGTVTLTLTDISPTGATELENTALATGSSPDGDPTEDRSNDGVDPDPGEDVPTKVTLEDDPRLGVAKAASVALQEDGSFTVTFDFIFRNYGNTNLVNVNATDDLSEFYADAGLTAENVSISSADLPVNGNFDGLTDRTMLAGGAGLAVGESASATITLSGLRVRERTSFENQAFGTGESPDGTPTEDPSHNGDDPDPDGDGDPTNNNDPTPVELTAKPVIGIAKKADLVSRSDGSFDLTLEFYVRNYGDVEFRNVQVRDSLVNLYELTNLEAGMLNLSSSDFSVNPAYDGDTDRFLLTGSDTLAVGGDGTITLLITGLRVTEPVHTVNTAVVEAETPDGDPIEPDRSQNGDDPDPDGDGDPTNNNDPTPIDIPGDARLGLAKRADVNPRGDGTYDITFTIVVRNYGNVALADVSVTDSLRAFYDNTSLSAADVSVSSGTFNVNDAFDGLTDTELLAPGNTLDTDARHEITIVLSSVQPDAGVTRLENSAYGEGTGPGGNTPGDRSQDGDDPDPDGDGNPGNNNDPTPVTFDDATSVLVDKQAGQDTYGIGDRVPYTVTLTNPNAVPLVVNITDTIPEHTSYIDGSAAFDPGSSTPAAGNEPRGADGSELTWRSVIIPADSEVVLTYELRILAGAEGNLENIVTADGRTSDGTPVSDESTSVIRVDPGVFDLTRSTLIGRVYIDVNRNDTYDEGIDIPLENARVVLSNGWQTLTDAQGNYAFRELDTGTWTVMVDRLTAPYEPQAHPEQLRDPRQHRVDVRGVTVSDFPFEELAGLADSRRETTVSFGPIDVYKYQVPLGDTVRTVLEVSSSDPWPPILITDPVPDAEAREFTVELDGGEPVFLTYDLPAGTQLTDPTIEWSNR